MRRALVLSAAQLFAGLASAQFQSMEESPYIAPSSPTGGNYDENTLFEARPLVDFRLYGNLDDQVLNSKWFGQKYDVVFDPMIRMFTSESVPVRMPSYRIFLSWTGMFLGGDTAKPSFLYSGRCSTAITPMARKAAPSGLRRTSARSATGSGMTWTPSTWTGT